MTAYSRLITGRLPGDRQEWQDLRGAPDKPGPSIWYSDASERNQRIRNATATYRVHAWLRYRVDHACDEFEWLKAHRGAP